MKIAYTTTFDAQDVHNWSGTPFHMSQALEEAGHQIQYVGNLKRVLPPLFKLKQFYEHYVCHQRISPRFNVAVAKAYSKQVEAQLDADVDVIISPLVNPIAYIETKKPLILWTDALYTSLLGFYAPFSAHSMKTIEEGNALTKACLDRCTYAVFSSDWAARAAIELYGTSKHKVKVIPFGANLSVSPSASDVAMAITKRDSRKIKLLFLAKSWERKGGDTVVAVAKALHEANYPVELHIVGYDHIPGEKTIPDYVHCHGFISKHNEAGKQQLQQLLSESHFLFVPSRAEAYGIVFCEANAYGVPCLTTHVGGIGTVIEDGKNGFTFGLDASIQDYVNTIVEVMQDRARYQALAESSYDAFATRLNWRSAIQELKRLF